MGNKEMGHGGIRMKRVAKHGLGKKEVQKGEERALIVSEV